MRTREIKKGARVVVVGKYGLYTFVGRTGTIYGLNHYGYVIVNLDISPNSTILFKPKQLQLVKDSREKQKYCKEMRKILKGKWNLKPSIECPYCKNKKDSQNGYKLPFAMKEEMNKHMEEWKNIIQPMLLITLKIEEKQQIKKKTNWSFWFIVLEVLVLLGLIIYFW